MINITTSGFSTKSSKGKTQHAKYLQSSKLFPAVWEIGPFYNLPPKISSPVDWFLRENKSKVSQFLSQELITVLTYWTFSWVLILWVFFHSFSHFLSQHPVLSNLVLALLKCSKELKGIGNIKIRERKHTHIAKQDAVQSSEDWQRYRCKNSSKFSWLLSKEYDSESN